MSRNASITDIAEDTCDILSNPETLELRVMAKGANWPDNIVNLLTVESDGDGALIINYPENITEDVENLEYGDINSLPTPVIRPFIYRAQNDVSRAIEKYALGEVMKVLGVV